MGVEFHSLRTAWVLFRMVGDPFVVAVVQIDLCKAHPFVLPAHCYLDLAQLFDAGLRVIVDLLTLQGHEVLEGYLGLSHCAQH